VRRQQEFRRGRAIRRTAGANRIIAQKQGLSMTPPTAAASVLTLARPDDWHLHLRDGDALASSVAASARVYARAIVMPNLKPPVTTVAAAARYRERILAALPPGSRFTPLLTLYLTDNTSPDEIARGKDSGFVHAVKYYPAGATTNSDSGVTALERTYPALAAMERYGVVLSLHGEVTDPDVDVFDRERVFVEGPLSRIVRDFPSLKVVLEHITTRAAADFVAAAPATIAATITPQHLLHSRNALFVGGLRPHLYCLPLLKREADRRALVAAATSGNPKFFLGTDSAPHARPTKENACGCAGCYSAPLALELYAEVFEDAGVLQKLEGFASWFGADFYGLPRNTERVTLVREPWTVPGEYSLGTQTVVPLRAGETLRWRLAGRVLS
jgi:dihydroorotase